MLTYQEIGCKISLRTDNDFMKQQFFHFAKYVWPRVLGLLVGLVVVEVALTLTPADVLNILTSYYQRRAVLYKTDPQIGWRLKPEATIRHTLEDEFDVQVKLNAQGLNDFEHPYEKPPETFRILMLGDSFTEGISVPIAQGFPHRLEVCLNAHYTRPVEVINSGTAYYATTEELFFLQHEGLRYDPDLVLVGFFIGNDLDAYAARENNDGWLQSLGGYLIELDETGALQKRWVDWQNPSPYDEISTAQLLLRQLKTYNLFAHPDTQLYNAIDDFQDNFKKNWLARRITGFFSAQSRPEAAKPDDFRNNFSILIYAQDYPYSAYTHPKLVENWHIIDNAFSKMDEVSAASGADLGVLILPEKMQSSLREYEAAYQKYAGRYGVEIANVSWDYAAPNKALNQLLAQKRIPAFDLLPVYRQHDAEGGSPIFFQDDPHLNPRGHQLTADAVCEWVIKNTFIPAQSNSRLSDIKTESR